MRFYKDILKHVRIKIVEASSSILKPFEDRMKDEAIKRLTMSVEIDGVGTMDP